jgi:hypothetical protein
MDPGDSCTQTLKTTSQEIQEVSVSDSGDVFQPAWIRRAIRTCNEMDRIVSDNRPYLLWHVGILFWIILFLDKKG